MKYSHHKNPRFGSALDMDGWFLTVHVDLLAQLYQLHLRGHVSHGPHAVAEVFTADETVLVLVKLFESIPQLCGAVTHIFQ